jgi:hypothetical protein
MKKFIRFVSLLVLLCVCLSGCSYLDELRASRASLEEDGSVVLADGTKYLLLPENKYFCYDYTNNTSIYVMEDEEVPLLLITGSGNSGFITPDRQFLRVYLEGVNQYYCREDTYESMLERMNNSFTPELYCYSYYDYDTFYDYETYEQVLYTFTPQQAEALESVLANQEPLTLPAGAKLDYDYQVSLDHYSSDYLFRKDSVDICFSDGTFYVVDGELIYKVPDSLYVTFARAVKKYLE